MRGGCDDGLGAGIFFCLFFEGRIDGNVAWGDCESRRGSAPGRGAGGQRTKVGCRLFGVQRLSKVWWDIYSGAPNSTGGLQSVAQMRDAERDDCLTDEQRTTQRARERWEVVSLRFIFAVSVEEYECLADVGGDGIGVARAVAQAMGAAESALAVRCMRVDIDSLKPVIGW